MKQMIKKIPLIGFLLRWSYNLLRLNNIKYRLFELEKNHISKDEFNAIQERIDSLKDELLRSTKEDISIFQRQFQEHISSPAIPKAVELEAIDYIKIANSKLRYSKEELKNFTKDDIYYSLFENVFYNHEVVLEKQKVYLNHLTRKENQLHLDVGCGRGEFLQILKEANYDAKGIDINDVEIKTLLKKDYDVKHIDMITYLKDTKEKFSSISALQVVEHIKYDTLKEFISLSYNRLQKDGVIILETINPHNKVAFNSFYMDETHKRPLPPEMLAFMLQYHNFKNVKYIYTSPMPDELRSKTELKVNYHDYAVIGYKI